MTQINETSDKKNKIRFPIITLLLFVLGAFGLSYDVTSAPLTIVVLGLTTIGLIIFGERYGIDDALEKRGLPGREAWLPVIALSIAVYLGAVTNSTVFQVIAEKSDIIALILSFAIISEGIARSGYFSFAAHKIVRKCQGNTTRLILYLFILTSALTFVTSNDIVVLVFTPIIIAVCIHARIENMRLLLLSQFIAANTLSMGLLIGSPTNIILSNELGINFVEYFIMMLIPSLLACMLTFIVVDFINKRSRPGTRRTLFNFKKRWTYHDHYTMPTTVKYNYFTDGMKYWLWLFTAAVGLVAVVSNMDKSLFFAAIPITVFSLSYLFYEVRKENNGQIKPATQSLKKVMASLPYSIFFFGMSYFAFASELSQQNYVIDTLLPFINENLFDELVKSSVSMVFLSGILVNTMNDLPAAALVSELLQQMDIHHSGLGGYTRMVVIQALLIGLNIGCYVTPIGALAGLLWFNIIRREERSLRKEMEADMKERNLSASSYQINKHILPDRMDLVKYGLITFIFVGLISGLLLPFIAQILDIFVSGPNDAIGTPVSYVIGLDGYLPLIGTLLIVFTIMKFRRVLAENSVFLGHMREIFVILTRIRIWSVKKRALYHILIGISILIIASAALYWSEIKHYEFYGAQEDLNPLFQSLKEFVHWLLTYTSSGLSEELQPRSTLGLALTGVLPMLTIGIVVMLSRLSTEDGMVRLSQLLVKGEIPGYRIVIINHHSDFENFVNDILSTKDASVLLLCSASQIDRAQSFCNAFTLDKEKSYRVYAALKSSDVYHNFAEYKMNEANEIYLLSDMTVEGEYEKLRYLTKLDEATNNVRLSQVETSALNDGHNEDPLSLSSNFNQSNNNVFATTLPKIVIESSSRRFDNLVKRSSSQFLLKDLVQISFDDELANFIFSDLDSSLHLLNRYYRFGDTPENPDLFVDNKSPNSENYLASYPLDEAGKNLLGSYFGSSAVDVRNMDLHDLVQHSMVIRRALQNKMQQTHYIKGNKEYDIPSTDFFGVVVNIAGEPIHMGVPSAAMSMQAASTERVIIKEVIKNNKKLSHEPIISADLRIFVFNLTPISKAFIRKILNHFDGQKKAPDVFILSHGTHSVPEDMQKNKMVTLVHENTIEDLLNKFCPSNSKIKSKNHVRPGDRLYVFNDFDTGSNPELNSIDFLDRLDVRIKNIVNDTAKTKTPRITHRDLYIAVEVQGNEGRFLFENFFVDKIIDTSRPRVVFLEVLSKILYRIIGEGSLLGYKQPSHDDFLKASEIGHYLSRFVIEFAEDVDLKDLNGQDICFTGLDYKDASRAIQSYSTPPKQMFARVKLVSCEQKVSKGKTEKSFKLETIPESVKIKEGDIIICLPLI